MSSVSQTAGAEDIVAGGDIVLAWNIGEDPNGTLASVDVVNSRETITFTANQTAMLRNAVRNAQASKRFYGSDTGDAGLDIILDSHGWKSGSGTSSDRKSVV